MNRKATPKQKVLSPSASTPGRVEQAGDSQRGDDRPGVERAGAAIDRPLDDESEADGQQRRPSPHPGLGVRLLEQQQCPEYEQEDPDPGQAGPAGVVGSPFPL